MTGGTGERREAKPVAPADAARRRAPGAAASRPPGRRRRARVGPRWVAASLGVATSSVAALGIAMASCHGSTSRAPDAAPQARALEPSDIAELIYDGGLAPGWQQSGAAAPEAGDGGPARVRLGEAGEWILTRPGLKGTFAALVFRVREPPGEGEVIEVVLRSADGHAIRPVKLKPDHRTPLADGWAQVLVPMLELDPDGLPFESVVFRPFRPMPEGRLLFDRIGLAAASAAATPAYASALGGGAVVRARVSCDQRVTKISPFIYGVAFGDDSWPQLGATARRWGGNATSRYNWEGNFSNRANDWFFENRTETGYADYLAAGAAHHVPTAITLPMLGWVAKDGTSYGFPVSKFGPQAKTDPWRADAGNGVTRDGANIPPGPPTETSVAAPPEWVKRWVETLRAADAKAGERRVYEYILDNEPALWSSTHRDVHPDPVGYDELLDRTIRYGTAVREADPNALIAGPAEWGWTNYFQSAKDLAGRFGIHWDRRAHEDLPLVEWYLRRLRDHEHKTGVRLLDVFDLHFYPQAPNVYGGGRGGSDRATQLLRLRSTRSLWDPTYADESWIKEPVRLLPRMHEWVDRNYPGRGLSIGEWNFGGEGDVTGALATAEALGRFAQFGVTSAFYWTAPPSGSTSTFGFLAFRNFDGRGGRFLDWYVPTSPLEGISLFASRDEAGRHVVVVAINMSPDVPRTAEIDLAPCGPVASQQAYVYTGGPGFAPSAVGPAGATLRRALPPWSISVIDVQLGDGRGGP